MSRRVTILVTALSCGILACGPEDEDTDTPMVDQAAAMAALQAADSAYSRVGQTKDIEAGVALYAPNAHAYPPEAPVVSGLDGIRGMFESFLGDPNFSASFEPVLVSVSADGDMGYTMNDATITATGPDGNAVTERIHDFHVWRKQPDGSWKVVIDIWNAMAPDSM